MNKKTVILLVIILSMSFLAYYNQITQKRCVLPEGDIIATVNNYKVTTSDIIEKMYHYPYSSEKSADLDAVLDLIIREQILIEEAQRLGLDKRKTFMKSIERYWKQTLIKELLDEESQRIGKAVEPDKQEQVLKKWIDSLYKKTKIDIDSKAFNNFKEGFPSK